MASKIDVWLSRFSQLAQVGVFLLAVFGVFYTVIPLYQNAVLSEAIADKELKLSALQDKLHSIQTNILQYAIGGFILRAGSQCSGLLEDAQYQEGMRDFLQGKVPGPSKQDEYIKNNAIDKCLLNIYEEKDRLSGATKESKEQFEIMFTRIAHELENSRQVLLKAASVNETDIDNYRLTVKNSLSKLNQVKINAAREE